MPTTQFNPPKISFNASLGNHVTVHFSTKSNSGSVSVGFRETPKPSETNAEETARRTAKAKDLLQALLATL